MDYQIFWGGNAPTVSLTHFKHADLFSGFKLNRWYVVATDANNEVAGIAGFLPSMQNTPNALGIGFVEVASAFRNNGIAKGLVKRLMRLARKAHKSLYVTPYSPNGAAYLQPFMAPLASQMGVSLIQGSY